MSFTRFKANIFSTFRSNLEVRSSGCGRKKNPLYDSSHAMPLLTVLVKKLTLFVPIYTYVGIQTDLWPKNK